MLSILTILYYLLCSCKTVNITCIQGNAPTWSGPTTGARSTADCSEFGSTGQYTLVGCGFTTNGTSDAIGNGVYHSDSNTCVAINPTFTTGGVLAVARCCEMPSGTTCIGIRDWQNSFAIGNPAKASDVCDSGVLTSCSASTLHAATSTHNDGCYPGAVTDDRGDTNVSGLYEPGLAGNYTNECTVQHHDTTGDKLIPSFTCCSSTTAIFTCYREYGAKATGEDVSSTVSCRTGYTMMGCSGYGENQNVNQWMIRDDGICYARTRDNNYVVATGICCKYETESPTLAPTTDPTLIPSISPTQPPSVPSQPPSQAPSQAPSRAPSQAPSQPPSQAPSQAPSQPPSLAPSLAPSNAPSLAPSFAPSISPSISPSIAPSFSPSLAPSMSPTQPPSIAPSMSPTQPPSHAPSIAPSISPTQPPSISPSIAPSLAPSVAPSMAPTQPPSLAPSVAPSISPSLAPSLAPTQPPSRAPTKQPTNDPTFHPTNNPTSDPTKDPTTDPTLEPTTDPTVNPTFSPTPKPTSKPVAKAQGQPAPTGSPNTAHPTKKPTEAVELQVVDFDPALFLYTLAALSGMGALMIIVALIQYFQENKSKKKRNKKIIGDFDGDGRVDDDQNINVLMLDENLRLPKELELQKIEQKEEEEQDDENSQLNKWIKEGNDDWIV